MACVRIKGGGWLYGFELASLHMKEIKVIGPVIYYLLELTSPRKCSLFQVCGPSNVNIVKYI